MLDKSKINQSIVAIIREAGLYHRQLLEFNDIDSDVIVLGDFILADTSKDAVSVLVDGKPVDVVEVDVKNATVTVETPIKSGQNVVVRFASSSVELDFVEKVRSEALSEMLAKIPCSSGWSDEHIPALGYIQRLLAAGMLLVRDYGFNEDIVGTSKDGYKKMELANERIGYLTASVCGGGRAASIGGFAGYDEGDLFQKRVKVNSEDW